MLCGPDRYDVGKLPAAVAPELALHHLFELHPVEFTIRGEVLSVLGQRVVVIPRQMNALVNLLDIRAKFFEVQTPGLILVQPLKD